MSFFLDSVNLNLGNHPVKANGGGTEGAHTHQRPPPVGFESQDPSSHLGELGAVCLWPTGSIVLGFCVKFPAHGWWQTLH